MARPEDFASLERRGIRIGAPTRSPDGTWSIPLEHREWGRATLVALRDPPLPPEVVVNMDARLNDEEKAVVRSAGYAVAITVEPRSGNVLADRKGLLRFLHAAMLEEGIAVVDHSAQTFWSRQALDEELAHDAELDIDSIYTMHLVLRDTGAPSEGDRRVFWLHTHGLQEIGFRDFDVLDPAPALEGQAHDLLRALAFGSVEGRFGNGTPAFDLAVATSVRSVPAREFLARTSPSEYRTYREHVDDTHLDGHGVVCDPAPSGLLSRLVRRSTPRPSRFLHGPFPDEVLIQFSSSATELMARRAHQMLPLLRELAAELAEFEFPVLVKLGYRVDGGGVEDREHLWFQVHGFESDSVDATLLNAPFHVGRLREGDRGSHALELLSDWAIHTPFGAVSPRQGRTLRFIRDNRERLREAVAAARKETP